jgi:hypothetical protein
MGETLLFPLVKSASKSILVQRRKLEKDSRRYDKEKVVRD